MTSTSRRSTTWTVERVRALGLTTDVATAGHILGLSRTRAYALAQSGEFPIPVLHAGRRLIVPVPALLTALGLSTETSAESASTGVDE
jgi:hypothetical protein